MGWSRTKTVGFVLFQIVAGVLLLELVLQAGAVIVWLSRARRPAEGAFSARDGLTILAVGDSYTFGLGASSPEASYPAALQRALVGRGLDRARVVNGGWPGQNSRDVLERLDGQLEELEPAFVLVMVGANDAWSHPEPLELVPAGESDAPEGFRFRWRTARLLKLAFGGAASPEPAAEKPGEGDASQEADGSRPENPSLSPPPSPASEVRQLADRIGAHVFAGRMDAAREGLSELRSLHELNPSRATAEAMVRALSTMRERDRALALAEQLSETYPSSGELWAVIGSESYDAGDVVRAEEALERALELGGDWNDVQRAWMTRKVGLAAARGSPDEAGMRKALRLNIEAMFLDGDVRASAMMLGGISGFNRELAKDYLAGLEVDDDRRAEIQRLYDALFARSDDSFVPVLESHLRQLAHRVRAHGAVPLLLTYPFPHPAVRQAQERVAEAEGVELVKLEERFGRELQSRDRSELFVADGHCSDAGYTIVADMVADTLARYVPVRDRLADEAD